MREARGVCVLYVLISRQSTRAQGGACTVHGVQGPARGSDFFSLSPLPASRTCIRSLILNCEMRVTVSTHRTLKPSEFTNSNTFALYQLIRNDINGHTLTGWGAEWDRSGHRARALLFLRRPRWRRASCLVKQTPPADGGELPHGGAASQEVLNDAIEDLRSAQ